MYIKLYINQIIWEDHLWMTEGVVHDTISRLDHRQSSSRIRDLSFRYTVMTLSACLIVPGNLALALAGGIRKGQIDGNLDSVFANTVSEYWFCLETFKVDAFISEARDSREVRRGYWDRWSATKVDFGSAWVFFQWKEWVASFKFSGNNCMDEGGDGLMYGSGTLIQPKGRHTWFTEKRMWVCLKKIVNTFFEILHIVTSLTITIHLWLKIVYLFERTFLINFDSKDISFLRV